MPRVKGVDGREYQWKLQGRAITEDQTSGKSSPHLRVRLLLRKLYPFDARLEEVSLPGSGGLTADFYLPGQRLMVEAHGRQHFEFVPHFHKDQWGFLRARQRDLTKQYWCELNDIHYCALPDDESESDWERRLRGNQEDGGGETSGME